MREILNYQQQKKTIKRDEKREDHVTNSSFQDIIEFIQIRTHHSNNGVVSHALSLSLSLYMYPIFSLSPPTTDI